MPKRSRFRITKRSVDALDVREKEYIAWDRDLAGFGVRVLKSGRKVYLVQTRDRAGSRRVSLGHHGKLSPDQARKRAVRFICRIRQEHDPNSKSPDVDTTVAELAARYMRVDASVNCKPVTVELYRCVIDNHIVPAMGERKIGDVEHADVAALHHRLRNTPGMANCTLQVLSQMFRTAERWGLLVPGSSPCRSHRKFRLRTRERFLTPEEYRRLGRVLAHGEADGSYSEPAVAALRLLILTGCRRDEILTLRWDDVDFGAGELRLRDSKTGPQNVALTLAVKTVLDGIPRLPGNPWVITGERPGRRLMTLKSTWRRGQAKGRSGRHAVARPAPFLCIACAGDRGEPVHDRQTPESRPDGEYYALRAPDARRRARRCGARRRRDHQPTARAGRDGEFVERARQGKNGITWQRSKWPPSTSAASKR